MTRDARVARPGMTPVDAIGVGSLVAISAALGLLAIYRRPDLTTNVGFLFADPALNLVVAERMRDGERLYSDVAFQYGPVSIYAYAAFAAVVGNTARAYLGFLLAWSVVNIGLGYALLRSRVGPQTAVLVAGGGFAATLLIPGSIAGASLSSTYTPMERTCLLLIALLWSPIWERTRRRALLLGVVLGIWQGIRFGAPVFAGVAIVFVDLLSIWAAGGGRVSLRSWFRVNLTTLAGFLAVEGVLLAYAFIALPRHAALDLVWPAYILDSFTQAPAGTRWLAWAGWKYFLGQALIPAAGFVATLVAAHWIVRACRWPTAGARSVSVGPSDFRLLVPASFFIIASFFYFRTVWHFQQFFWTLVPPVALLLHRGGWPRQLAWAAICAPGIALLVKVLILSPIPASVVALETPRGEQLWVERSVPKRVESIVARVRSPDGANAASDVGDPELIIIQMGTGVHHYYDIPMNLRQSWYIPGFMRPPDQQALLALLDARPAVIVLTDHPVGERPSMDPCEWYHVPYVPREICAPLAQRLGRPEQLDSITWAIPAGKGAARAVGSGSP